MRVFISWSGDRSKLLAEALHWLLRRVLQEVKPWVSLHGIKPGEIWFETLRTELGQTGMAILCLTNENAERPWIMFEAGAVGARIADRTRVVPYLLDFSPGQLKPPLQMFNAVEAKEQPSRVLVESINALLEGHAINTDELDDLWGKFYPDYAAKLANIPPPGAQPPAAPTEAERLASIEAMLRQFDPTVLSQHTADFTRLEHFLLKLVQSTRRLNLEIGPPTETGRKVHRLVRQHIDVVKEVATKIGIAAGLPAPSLQRITGLIVKPMLFETPGQETLFGPDRAS